MTERRTTVVTTHKADSTKGGGDNKRVTDYPLDLLTDDPANAPASVTRSVGIEVSDYVYWGKGTYDRVSYGVKVFSSVTLRCEQNESAIVTAQNIANEFAWQGVHRAIQPAVQGHEEDIRDRLYPDLFEET
ncbi:MAG: hypothetical protein ACOYOB_21005 [Myxococcota bacterium]